MARQLPKKYRDGDSLFSYSIITDRPLSKIGKADAELTDAMYDEKTGKELSAPRPILLVPFTVKQHHVSGSRWLGGHKTLAEAEAEITELQRIERRYKARLEALQPDPVIIAAA
jgi:hypothetical protein